jgi:hypothetical protein
MTLEHPRTHYSSPKWDLLVVLRALMGFPFEPMDKVSFKYLTFKTAFLVALATDQRRSELQQDCLPRGWG